MSRLALELVDSGLVWVSPRGNVTAAGPGLAMVDGATLQVGVDAVSTARLKPRRLHSRFWQDLSTAPLSRPFPHHLRSADLAHAHLQRIWSSAGEMVDEVVVAVPGLYSEKQLGLFLGIAEACDMPVRGLVDAAVAASVDRATGPDCLHLDLHLHRAVLTAMEHRTEIVRDSVWEEKRVGLLGLYDIWARVVATIFVRSTRFDPLHHAATEQILYSQIPEHLLVLAENDSSQVTITSGGRQHTTELLRREIVDAARSSYQRISDWVSGHAISDETTLLVGDRMAVLPGLVDHLIESTGLDVHALHPAAAGSAALHHANDICSASGDLSFVTRLPGYDARPPGPVTIAVTPPVGIAVADSSPTHVVVDGLAHRISEEPIVLGSVTLELDGGEAEIAVRRLGKQVIVEAPREAVVTINGQSIDGAAALASGDRLGLGSSDTEILLVAMAD